jgi:hypothetical protein
VYWKEATPHAFHSYEANAHVFRRYRGESHHRTGITAGTPSTVLFVGDSLTYFQKGVYTHFDRLAAGFKPPVLVTADHSTFPGAFLHRLWDLKDPVKAIDKGSYDVVVLQEDIPETTVADFREYVRKFVAEIRKVHARPVLFMAWAYSRLDWISMAKIAQRHQDAEKELDVEVVPVGLAWQQASKQRPWMDFYGPDQEHPSILRYLFSRMCALFKDLRSRLDGVHLRCLRNQSGRGGILASRLADRSGISYRPNMRTPMLIRTAAMPRISVWIF